MQATESQKSYGIFCSNTVEKETEMISTSLNGKLEVHRLIKQLMKSWYSDIMSTESKALVDVTAIPLKHIRSPKVL